MSDESGDPSPATDPQGPATDPQGPATDPWGNPLPAGTVQQPPRSALPPPAPPQPDTPVQSPPGDAQWPPPAAHGAPPPPPPTAPGQRPESWWPADPEQPSPDGAKDAWGQPVGAPPIPSPYGQQPGYPSQPGYPPYQGYPGQPVFVPPRNAGTAIGAFICGLFSIFCVGYLGVLLGPVAIVLGITTKRKIAKSNGQLKGAGLATAGIVLGAVGVAVSIAWLTYTINNPNYLDDFLHNLTTTTSTPS